jgi:hypothetical protein
MSLPEAWVDRIFTKLSLVYGHQFLSRWDGLAIADVKADWGHELARFQQNPGAISYALEHLPAGKAPTVLEFRAICNSPQAPEPERVLALPAMLEREDDGSRTLERLQRVRAAIPDVGGYAWAFALELKDREDHAKVTPLVRELYREAIGNYRKHGGRVPA